MCGLAVGAGWGGTEATAECVCVRAHALVMLHGRGLGDNHRFEEGLHSKLTNLIEPLGKNKAEAIGRDVVEGGRSPLTDQQF